MSALGGIERGMEYCAGINFFCYIEYYMDLFPQGK